MMISVICCVICLQQAVHAQNTSGQINEHNLSKNQTAVFVAAVLVLLTLACIVHQRRNRYPIIRYFRQKIHTLKGKIQDIRSRQFQVNFQIANDQVLHSAKRGIQLQSFQTEKTEREIDVSGMVVQQNHFPNTEMMQAMQIESDSPQVDMKDIFQKKKQSKASNSVKNKNKKPKTKSKIRGRLQSKMNDQDQNEKEVGEEQVQQNTLTEEKQPVFPTEDQQQNKQNQA